jgi:hypothetical protein
MTILESPRTSYVFTISGVGVDLATSLTWQSSDAEFVKMARICFGLPIDGPPPMWHLLEVMQIIRDHQCKDQI